jgi:hypothetical protein
MLFAALAATAFQASAADRIPIVNEGSLGDHWTLVPATQQAPAYPEAFASKQDKVCVTVGYVIGTDGYTSDYALVKSWSSSNTSSRNTDYWGAFANAASQALAQRQYAPKAGADAKPVFTSTTFAFGGDEDATRAHCAISDLTTRMVELRYNDRAGRMMAGGIYARLDIDPNVEARTRHRNTKMREYEQESQMRVNEADLQATSPPPSSSK